MANPWDIYSILWQNGTFITSQKLQENSTREDNIRNFSFLNTLLCYQWGIHNLQIDTSKLQSGLIRIKSVQCTFPNGENFVYDSNWRKVNGEDYLQDDNSKIYSIECNCADYSMLFTNKNYVEIGIIMESNPFRQNVFVPILSETRDMGNSDDINEVGRQFPVIRLLPTEIAGNNSRNFIPIMHISIKNGIYKALDYQYPASLLSCDTILFTILREFIDRLYGRLSYIQQENKTTVNQESILRFLHCIMGNVFLLNSTLKNENTAIYQIYYFFLKLLGDLDCFGDFDFSYYPYIHRDLLGTFQRIITRITIIVEDFYEIGEFLYFTMENPQSSLYSDGSDSAIYVLSRETEKFKDEEIYFDIKAVGIEKITLEKWIDNSIICGDGDFQKNKMEKKRGINRELLSFKLQEKQNSNLLFLRYKLDLTNLGQQKKLIIFNPIILQNITLMLIKKSTFS